MRTVALALIMTAGLAATAQAVFTPFSRTENIDGDRALERAETVRFVGTDGLEGVAIKVTDICRSGRIETLVAGPDESLGDLKLTRSDTRPGLDILVDLRRGAAGRAGQGSVIGWRGSRGRFCRTPRHLFHYDSDRPTRRPSGAQGLASFVGLRVLELDRRFPGREVELTELFARRGESAVNASITKRSLYRYDARRDRYRHYRTAVTRRG